MTSRNLEVVEIRPAMIIFTNPTHRFLTCPGRLIHPYFQVMESIWILAGRGDVSWISKYLKNIEKYSDGEDVFHAPYGHRMRRYGYNRSIFYGDDDEIDQFENCLIYLFEKPDTRHAVMTYWNPLFDRYGINTIDRPCNIAFHFMIREDKLDLTIMNRSNDIHWGLMNANVVQFSVILETAAMILGIPVGKQIHMIDSLHYYIDNPITDEILSKDYEFNVYDYVHSHPFDNHNNIYHYSSIAHGGMIAFLDSELKMFFDHEEKIWTKAQFPNIYLEHSFLNDGLILAYSFYKYKKADYESAAQVLLRLRADDLFVSCLEFLNRKSPDERTKAVIEATLFDRFNSKLSKFQIKEIQRYIERH